MAKDDFSFLDQSEPVSPKDDFSFLDASEPVEQKFDTTIPMLDIPEAATMGGIVEGAKKLGEEFITSPAEMVLGGIGEAATLGLTRGRGTAAADVVGALTGTAGTFIDSIIFDKDFNAKNALVTNLVANMGTTAAVKTLKNMGFMKEASKLEQVRAVEEGIEAEGGQLLKTESGKTLADAGQKFASDPEAVPLGAQILKGDFGAEDLQRAKMSAKTAKQTFPNSPSKIALTNKLDKVQKGIKKEILSGVGRVDKARISEDLLTGYKNTFGETNARASNDTIRGSILESSKKLRESAKQMKGDIPVGDLKDYIETNAGVIDAKMGITNRKLVEDVLNKVSGKSVPVQGVSTGGVDMVSPVKLTDAVKEMFEGLDGQGINGFLDPDVGIMAPIIDTVQSHAARSGDKNALKFAEEFSSGESARSAFYEQLKSPATELLDRMVKESERGALENSTIDSIFSSPQMVSDVIQRTGSANSVLSLQELARSRTIEIALDDAGDITMKSLADLNKRIPKETLEAIDPDLKEIVELAEISVKAFEESGISALQKATPATPSNGTTPLSRLSNTMPIRRGMDLIIAADKGLRKTLGITDKKAVENALTTSSGRDFLKSNPKTVDGYRKYVMFARELVRQGLAVEDDIPTMEEYVFELQQN